MNNKRGDVPVVILTIGVFVLCSLALLSFIGSSSSFGNSFKNVDLMEEMNSNINEYNFLSSSLPTEQIKSFIAEDNFYIEEDKFIINETKTKFHFALSLNKEDWIKEELSFSVKYYYKN